MATDSRCQHSLFIVARQPPPSFAHSKLMLAKHIFGQWAVIFALLSLYTFEANSPFQIFPKENLNFLSSCAKTCQMFEVPRFRSRFQNTFEKIGHLRFSDRMRKAIMRISNLVSEVLVGLSHWSSDETNVLPLLFGTRDMYLSTL